MYHPMTDIEKSRTPAGYVTRFWAIYEKLPFQFYTQIHNAKGAGSGTLLLKPGHLKPTYLDPQTP